MPIPSPGDLAPGFTVEAGRCWRMVFNATVQGSHCPAPVAWRGRFRNHAGQVRTVWACEAHTHELSDLSPTTRNAPKLTS
jgi:hypothetical protein